MGNDISEQVTYSAAQLREGLPDLEGHPHAGMIQDDDRRGLISFLATVYDGDIKETEIYQDIVRTEATESLTDAVTAGNVSQMQFAVGMVDHDEDAQQSGQAWLRDAILSEAYVGWVTGGMGSGKTDFALDRLDDWQHATRGRAATNIKSAAERNDGVTYAGGFQALEDFFKSAPGPAFYVLDETDQNLSGSGSDQQDGDRVADALKLIRKGEGSAGSYRGILLIGQTVRGATKELRRLVTSNGHLYHKSDKTTVEVYDDVVTGELSSMTPQRRITGVRETRLSFDSAEASDFETDGDQDGDDVEDGSLSREQAIAQAVKAYKPWSDDHGVT